MSDNTSSHTGGAGRIWLWVVLALTVLLLGFVTATAARANPIYSDRDAYGISKYRLIEDCREHLFEPDNLPLTLGPGQTQPLLTVVQSTGAMTPNKRLLVESDVAPNVVDDSVQPDSEGNLLMTLPVVVKLVDRQNGGVQPLAPLQMQCSYNKTQKRLNVSLVPGGV